MKLHIGCGDKYLEGFVHIDARPGPHIDHVSDVSKLPFIQSGSCDEIYACHILEHFGRHQYTEVLLEWARALKKGGVLRISVPDFDAIVAEYNSNKNIDSLIGLLYGGQNYQYNFHYMAYNFDSLTRALKTCGFNNIQRYDWQSFLPENYDDFSRAYLPHMDLTKGRLMSLNVTAEKV